jgi:phage repressor protein C with HTH and peptisase S24 domain
MSNAAQETGHNCGDAEPFALMVLGDSMEPEFNEGDVIVIEPGSRILDGSYVLAYYGEEYIFRQLKKTNQGWMLHALNSSYPDFHFTDLSVVRGIITQKSRKGKRGAAKVYIA